MNDARRKLSRTIHQITINLLKASRIVSNPLPPPTGEHMRRNYQQGAVNLIQESLELLNIDVEELSLELTYSSDQPAVESGER